VSTRRVTLDWEYDIPTLMTDEYNTGKVKVSVPIGMLEEDIQDFEERIASLCKQLRRGVTKENQVNG
jgi:hypothetical protein